MPVCYQAKVPGSLMLMGEHAVLSGYPALVVAVNRYLSVRLTPRTDHFIKIRSSFGEQNFTLKKITIMPPHEYILAAILSYRRLLKVGFELEVQTEFASTIGFGSSAAVTVATLAVLAYWLTGQCAKSYSLQRRALRVIHTVHAVGSGADLAASLLGGVVHYQIKPYQMQQIALEMPLYAVYSGSKLATYLVIQDVKQRAQLIPRSFAALYRAQAACVREAIPIIRQRDWSRLGVLMNLHQGLQDALGVNNWCLAQLIFTLRQDVGIYGAKISGSGLGDSIIGCGELRDAATKERLQRIGSHVELLPIEVSKTGLQIEILSDISRDT